MHCGPSMTSSDASEPPSPEDVKAAAQRLRGYAVRTPLLESPLLNDHLGGRLLVKAETLQRTGSFKFRGAFNRLAQLTPSAREQGVVAYSSGNHAQGVAAAAQILHIPALIVMPADAPAAKIAGTHAYGAEVAFYDRRADDREAIAEALARERGATLVPPFDDPRIIAGQGTTGLELAEQAEEAEARLDDILVPCSGGGLSAGIAVALADSVPTVRVSVVEPAGFDDAARSLAAGERLPVNPGGTSICDALMAPRIGALTFAALSRHRAGAVAVDDAATKRAVRTAFETFRLVCEPSGAIALAAVLEGAVPVSGRTVAVVASGGNVDAEVFAGLIAG